mgnify:CR=1 FL=1
MKQRKNFLIKLSRFIKLTYIKLCRINDSPIKTALGFGLGVLMGVIPGVGPIAALFLAIILKVNRASALLGSLLFNTWSLVVISFLSIKAGPALMGLNAQEVYNGWLALISDFTWGKLCEASLFKVITPIVVGYLIISLLISGIATMIVYFMAVSIRRRKQREKLKAQMKMNL